MAFASFSDLWFLDVAATTVAGKTIGVDGAAMVHMKNETGSVLCWPERWDGSNFVVLSGSG